MRKPKFSGAQRKVAREVLETFGVCGGTKEAVAARARASEQFAETLRRLDGDAGGYNPTQSLLGLAVGHWWDQEIMQADKTLTDEQFAEKAAWLIAEHTKRPSPIDQAECNRRVAALYEQYRPSWLAGLCG